MAAFSIKAIMAGVANTGMSPEPILTAVTASVTVSSLVCFNPTSTILFLVMKANNDVAQHTLNSYFLTDSFMCKSKQKNAITE
jgi:hypothetical protein